MATEKDLLDAVESVVGGSGCDYISGTGAFTARIGVIYALVSDDDATTIASIKEVPTPGAVPVEYTTGERSYIGSTIIKDGKHVIFDNGINEVTLGAGSAWVYYRAF